VCKEGIYIDPERVKEINELNPPSSKKDFNHFSARSILCKDLFLTMQVL
jgi:hypothetical protein